MTTFLAHGIEGDKFDVAEEQTDCRTTADDDRSLTVTGVSSGQRCVTVALHGSLNATTALMLFRQLVLFCVDDPWVMVADVRDLTGVDTDGVIALVDASQALKLRFCVLTISGVSADRRGRLALAGFQGFVER